LTQSHTDMTSASPGIANHGSHLEPGAGVPIIAREGWVIVASFALITALLWTGMIWLFGWPGHIIGAVGLAFTLWSIWFFRDPVRHIPSIPGVVVSPADGVICFVGPTAPPAELGLDDAQASGMTRISVFMNVFNVHVNRSPTDCWIARVAYSPGKFFNASLDKASVHNERCALLLRLRDGREMACVQIAGLIARRIVCKVGEGEALGTGQRFGLIRFGSRVDVYLPAGVSPRVKRGDRAVAGESIFALLQETP
jgi:phosphatidylserine decarboxylase